MSAPDVAGGPPRGKLVGVSAPVRRLWSLLYRAVRRQAVAVEDLRARVERLYAFATNLVATHRRELESVHRRLDALERHLPPTSARPTSDLEETPP